MKRNEINSILINERSFAKWDNVFKDKDKGINVSKQQINMTLSDQISIKDTLTIIQKRKGFKRPIKEIVTGHRSSNDLGLLDGVSYTRIIDRENNKYDQVVKDNITGNIIHEDHESLNVHK